MKDKDFLRTTYVFDKLHTVDGYEIYWLYKQGEYTNKYGNDLIQPDDLFYDEYAFEDQCRHIVSHPNYDFINYVFEEDEINEWIEEEEMRLRWLNGIQNKQL